MLSLVLLEYFAVELVKPRAQLCGVDICFLSVASIEPVEFTLNQIFNYVFVICLFVGK